MRSFLVAGLISAACSKSDRNPPPPPTPTATPIAVAIDAVAIDATERHIEVDAGCDEDTPLTAGGKRREAWVEEIAKSLSSGDPIHDWDYGVTVAAEGCDATTLLMAAGAHSGGGCDEAALRGFDHSQHKQLTKFGFTKLTCGGPDGPAVDVGRK